MAVSCKETDLWFAKIIKMSEYIAKDSIFHAIKELISHLRQYFDNKINFEDFTV